MNLVCQVTVEVFKVLLVFPFCFVVIFIFAVCLFYIPHISNKKHIKKKKETLCLTKYVYLSTNTTMCLNLYGKLILAYKKAHTQSEKELYFTPSQLCFFLVTDLNHLYSTFQIAAF